MKIIIDDLTGSEIADLLEYHLADFRKNTPGCVHALDIKALQKPEITFWSAWENDELLGCCALNELDGSHAELKSMRTSPNHLRKGVARKLLEHVIDVAKDRNYQRISLETSHTFLPAIELYKHFGFIVCEPFSDYTHDPESLYMSLNIQAGN